jgi:hypothetical protein
MAFQHGHGKSPVKVYSWENHLSLIGGLEHDFFIFPYIGNNDPN